MEIRRIEKIEKKEYPKLNEISKNKLKCSIPKKWSSLGITLTIFSVIMSNKILAANENDILQPEIGEITAGVMQIYNPIYDYARTGCLIVSIISSIVMAISFINILYTKIKSKKENKNININKKTKILFIISSIVLLLSIIGRLIVEYLD